MLTLLEDLILSMLGGVFDLLMIFILFAIVRTDFTVDQYLRMGFYLDLNTFYLWKCYAQGIHLCHTVSQSTVVLNYAGQYADFILLSIYGVLCIFGICQRSNTFM